MGLGKQVGPPCRELVVRRRDCGELTASNHDAWLGATKENTGSMRLRSNNATRREGRRQPVKIPATAHKRRPGDACPSARSAAVPSLSDHPVWLDILGRSHRTVLV